MKPWQVLTAIGIGAFLGVVVVCGGIGGWFMLLVQEEMRRQLDQTAYVPNINYLLRGPEKVVAGERFVLEAVVQNTAAEPQTLLGLEDYSGLVIHGTTPAFKNRQGDTLIFDLTLPPGAQQVIQIEAEAREPGPQSVNIDATINALYNYIEAFHDVEVLPPGSSLPQEGGASPPPF